MIPELLEAATAAAVGCTTSRSTLLCLIERKTTVKGPDVNTLQPAATANSNRQAGSPTFEVASGLTPVSNKFASMDRIDEEMRCPVTEVCTISTHPPSEGDATTVGKPASIRPST
ncbi:MAG: hypothetical protein ACI915_004065 [Gammaproteobacteria bacterium]|jgi:hypothetical protein